jgi:hypothetical protein
MSTEMRISLFAGLTVAIFWAALGAIGIWPFELSAYVANFALFLAAWAFIASFDALFQLARAWPDRPIAFLWKGGFFARHRNRLGESWPILLASVMFMPTFSRMKSAIPHFNEYAWDPYFIKLDQILHGQDAWLLLQPLLGVPVITSAVSLLYQVWILLIYAGTIYFALYVGDRRLRCRYFAAYFSIWLVNGVVLAIAFASVGPCFAEPILGIDQFIPQMEYLRSASTHYPVPSLDVQQALIDWYAAGSSGLGRGISAMPSMHVALAFLFFLAVQRQNKWAGMFFLGYAIVILIGSVHLAYHYAVDGYLSIAVTSVVWILSGAAFGRHRRVNTDLAFSVASNANR